VQKSLAETASASGWSSSIKPSTIQEIEDEEYDEQERALLKQQTEDTGQVVSQIEENNQGVFEKERLKEEN
jgi:hypothetical protein